MATDPVPRKEVSRLLQKFWAEVQEMLFPTWQDCSCCQDSLAQNGRSWGRSGLCRNCLLEIERLNEELVQCDRCGKYLKEAPSSKEPLLKESSARARKEKGTESVICENCQNQAPLFLQAWNIGPYEGLLRQAIHDLKYKGRRDLALPLGKIMAQQLWLAVPNSSLLNPWGDLKGAFLVPIPLYSEKLLRRNFNQSFLLAKAIEEETAFPVADILLRQADTETQAHLGRYDRLRNLEGQFVLQPQGLLGQKGSKTKAKAAILVDDVYTTGATVTEATKVLHQAGITSVYVVTAAAGIGL
ncbi:ComF family protein [Heliorestis convoluta]|uniref:ComF family protein n=2 Tax=Heliorestis convoluta TaxID=356322 RepID=A0A5Q2MXT4_9FIRM|nr:ComF family protein [Heliorestis convoluta]